jgi:hypothetical protein
VAEFKKCEDSKFKQKCTYSEDFNKLIELKMVDIKLLYLSAEVDLDNHASPFRTKPVYMWPQELYKSNFATLNPTQVVNQGDPVFTKVTRQTQLSFHDSRVVDKPASLFDFEIQLNNDFTDVYRRNYKHFSAGLASTLAIMKIVVWFFSTFSKIYFKNKLQNFLINDNFDYQGSFSPITTTVTTRRSINPLEKEQISTKLWEKKCKNF